VDLLIADNASGKVNTIDQNNNNNKHAYAGTIE
jgi:hypothetical protein